MARFARVKIHFSKRFVACLRDANDEQLQAVDRVCRLAEEAFGRPHRHAGIGLRRLSQVDFECRVGRERRLVFSREGDALLFDFAGNHDEVQPYLRNRG